MAAIAMSPEHGLYEANERASRMEAVWNAYEDWQESLPAVDLCDHLLAYLEHKKQVNGKVIRISSLAPFPGEVAIVQFNAMRDFEEWHFRNRYPGDKS
jgi:hypothetical protein